MMQAATAVFQKLQSDRRGVTALEYGVIAAAIVLAIVTIIATVGGNLTAVFTRVGAALQ